jgi:hypothetical protein
MSDGLASALEANGFSQSQRAIKKSGHTDLVGKP